MRYLNTATQQSVTEAQVRQSFPDVSLPEFLPDSIGDFVRIVETPQSNYDQTTHRIIDGGLVVADGKATRNWIIEPLPIEEVERQRRFTAYQIKAQSIQQFDEQAQSYFFMSARELMLAPAAIVPAGEARDLQNQIRAEFNRKD
jgi:hypothetical protein